MDCPMVGHIIQFVARGTPGALAKAMEADATGRGSVSMLVVPWESTDQVIAMAITLVKPDGWAIEHTNLGTATLTGLGHEQTEVTVVGHDTEHPERERLRQQLEMLGQHLRTRFQVPGAAPLAP
ncbi:MAG: hypothetical protein ACT4QD_17215 [Acidobacteriota bacterium]